MSRRPRVFDSLEIVIHADPDPDHMVTIIVGRTYEVAI